MIHHQRLDEATGQDLGGRHTKRRFGCSDARGSTRCDCKTHRQDILHGDYEDVVADQTVPVHQDGSDWLEQQVSPHQQEVETGHQIAHTEDADPVGAGTTTGVTHIPTGRVALGSAHSPGGSGDENNGENEPKHVAEDDHLHHVQVGPVDGDSRAKNDGGGWGRGSAAVGGANLHIIKSGTVLRRSWTICSESCPSSPWRSQLSPARI